MKTKIIIAFLLLALVSQAAPTIKTQRFVVSDSIRLFEPNDPDGNGYKLVKTVQMDWPVTINGKPATALTRYLLDSLFLASGANHDIVPYYPTDVNVIKDFVGDCVYRALNNNTMFDEYIKKSPLAVPDVDGEEFPLSRWIENLEFKFSHSEQDLAFFISCYEDYYGGAHGMYWTDYLPFDTRLNKAIGIKDVVTKPASVLRMLPKYDTRPAGGSWWDNVTDIDNFYIKQGKIVFVFAPYVAGPFADGEVEVAIPLSVLNKRGLLTAYGKKFLTKSSAKSSKRKR